MPSYVERDQELFPTEVTGDCLKEADTIDFEEARPHLLNLQRLFCLKFLQKTAVWSLRTQAILRLPVKAFYVHSGGVGSAEVS